jgi:hypothetical protein
VKTYQPEPSTFELWTEGQLNDREALEVLCRNLDRLEDQLEPLTEQRAVLRGHISEVVANAGGRIKLPDYGQLMITNPSVRAAYDRGKLDALVIQLTQTDPHLAQQIAACRSESLAAGSLRITRATPNPKKGAAA